MFSFHITEIRTIQISLAIIFVALGIIAALINFNFQVASDQRIQTLELTKSIHLSDSRNDNQTEFLVNQTLEKIQNISDNQRNDSKTLTDLLLQNQGIIKENQGIIKNTTGTNLNNTFINKKNIQGLVDAVKSFNLTEVKSGQSYEVQNLVELNHKLDILLNKTR